MRIAMAQMRTKAGFIDDNLSKMKKMIDQARDDKADLIVFPEMCVSGYLISDKYLQKGFIEKLLNANEILKEYSQGIGVIWGNLGVDFEHKNRDGRYERRNQAFFAYEGQWVKANHNWHDGIYVKHGLPDYRIFDDSRYFKSGIDVSLEHGNDETALIEPFFFKGHKIGLEVCEDLWGVDYRLKHTSI